MESKTTDEHDNEKLWTEIDERLHTSYSDEQRQALKDLFFSEHNQVTEFNNTVDADDLF